MQFNYFEEFPTDVNLEKARHLRAPAIVFLATPNLETFKERAKKLSEINISLRSVYWPTLIESYWISPFSLSSELDRLQKELESGEIDTILFDLELPLLTRSMFFSESLKFNSNKRKIYSLFALARKKNIRVYTAEYPATDSIMLFVFRFLGVSYPDKDDTRHLKIIMFYPNSLLKLSFSKFTLGKMMRHITCLAGKYPGRIEVGLGTIGKGKMTRESALSPEELSCLVDYFSKYNIKTATLFRLGEMTDKHFETTNR